MGQDRLVKKSSKIRRFDYLPAAVGSPGIVVEAAGIAVDVVAPGTVALLTIEEFDIAVAAGKTVVGLIGTVVVETAAAVVVAAAVVGRIAATSAAEAASVS